VVKSGSWIWVVKSGSEPDEGELLMLMLMVQFED